MDAYELSSYGSILKWLRKHFRSVSTSEYLPSGELGRLVNGTLNQDIQKLTFEDDSFDILTSNQVFEHVPDDRAGYRESYRVLRPGGALIFSVPYRFMTRRYAVHCANSEWVNGVCG